MEVLELFLLQHQVIHGVLLLLPLPREAVLVLGNDLSELLCLVRVLVDVIRHVCLFSLKLVGGGGEHLVDEDRADCVAVGVEPVLGNLLLVQLNVLEMDQIEEELPVFLLD